MSGPTDDDDTQPAGAGRRAAYPIPREMTDRGRVAFVDDITDYAAAITELAQAEARRAKGCGQEITADHVAAARVEYERRLRAPRAGARRATNLRATSTILGGAGTVGIPVMAPFLHSPWQVGLFGLFVLLLVVALGLAWAVRRHT